MDKLPLNIPFLLLLFIFASAQTASAQTDSMAGSATGFDTGKDISVKNDSVGGRSELSITEFITSTLPEFLRMYSARLLEKPGLSGKINFNFAIASRKNGV